MPIAMNFVIDIEFSTVLAKHVRSLTT